MVKQSASVSDWWADYHALKKITGIIVLSLGLTTVGGVLGYWAGGRQEREVHRNYARSHIVVNASLYHSTERGDLRQIQKILGKVLAGDVRNYEERFGVETGTDSFTRPFADARSIAHRVQSGAVAISSNLTNQAHSQGTKEMDP